MRRRNPEKLIAFENVTVENETKKALLVDFGDSEPTWIPKSQIRDGGEDGQPATDLDQGTIVVTEWIAVQKGLA